MPITFEQMGAYSPAISAAAGQAQAVQQMLPSILQAYRDQQNAYVQGYGLQQAENQRQIENARYIDPVSLYLAKSNIDEGVRKRQQNEAEQAIMAAVGQGSGAPPDQNRIMELMNQRAQAMGGLGQPDASPYGVVSGNSGNWRGLPEGQPAQQPPPEWGPEQERELAQLQNSRSAVNQQLRNGVIDPETARRAILQLRSGIDPLRMQQQAAQLAHTQQQNQILDQQVRDQARRENERRAALAQADPQGWVWRDLPDGTSVPMTWNDREGQLVVVPHYLQWMENQRHHMEDEQRRRDREDSLQQQREANIAARAELTLNQRATAFHQESQAVDREIAEYNRPGPPDASGNATMPHPLPHWIERGEGYAGERVRITPESRLAEIRRRVEARMQHLGLGQQSSQQGQQGQQQAPLATPPDQMRAFQELLSRLAPAPQPANAPRPNLGLRQNWPQHSFEGGMW